MLVIAMVIRAEDRWVGTMVFVGGLSVLVYALQRDRVSTQSHTKEPEDLRELPILRRTPVYL